MVVLSSGFSSESFSFFPDDDDSPRIRSPLATCKSSSELATDDPSRLLLLVTVVNCKFLLGLFPLEFSNTRSSSSVIERDRDVGDSSSWSSSPR
jgi:hypothetical protein